MHKQSDNKQNITAIILTGSRDFGRCPLASRLSTALWPLAGKPAIEHLLVHLVKQGIDRAVICSNGDGALLAESIHADKRLELEFLDEQLPSGTAGCVRDAVGGETDELLLIFPASMICPPKINVLISAHRKGQSDLTVMFNPNTGNGRVMGEAAGIYVCNPSVLGHIPKEGYFDIKESLIPKMLRAGKTIRAAVLPHRVGSFRNFHEYLRGVADYLQSTSPPSEGLRRWRPGHPQIIWMAPNARIHQSARVYGPVVLLEGACVRQNAVVLGPSIIGRNVSIGPDSVVISSVLWDNACVGSNCQLQNCVVDYQATVTNRTVATSAALSRRSEPIRPPLFGKASTMVKRSANRLGLAGRQLLGNLSVKLSSSTIPTWRKNVFPWVAAAAILIAFLWSYWSGATDLWSVWNRSDEYSVGLLVPFLAVYVLWLRRHDLARCKAKPCFWGLFAFIAALGLRVFGLFFMYGAAERLSIVLSIAALVLLLFGWQLFRKLSPVLVFLCFMLPWPNRVQTAVGIPLQRFATSSSVFCLETMGCDVMQEGNIIHVGQVSVAVAEACNGLRMVTAFFVIAGLVVLLVKRSWWEKLIILASSLPVALLCNTVRLTITALAFTVLTGEHWEEIFHDFGGYAMMPLAIAIVIAELRLLARLTTPRAGEHAVLIERQKC